MFKLCIWYFLSRSLNLAFARWGSYREAYCNLEKWYRRGIITERDEHKSDEWAVLCLKDAARSRVDGVLFQWRVLHGIRGIETSDSFWLPNPTYDCLPKSPTDCDIQFLLRYQCFSRLEMFYLIGNEAVLKGGLLDSFEPGIDALRAFLKRPRRMRIVSGDESIQCMFSGSWKTPDGVVAELVVNIAYQDSRAVGDTGDS